MTTIALHPHSILMKAPLLLVDGVPEWGIRTPLIQQALSDDQTYTTQDNDRLPLISHKVYGDVRLWWAVYDYNRSVIGKAHPLFLPSGLILRIPPIERIMAEIDNV